MGERSIIHLNVADFAVAVERVVDVRLRRRPVIIAPEAAVRAAVYDMSEEAYQSGVRKNMPLGRALRYCRGAVVLPPHPDRYERAMARLLKLACPYSPLIEVTDYNGHLFVDTTGTGRLFGPPPDVAWRIRKAIRADLGFDPIWSVATNKLVAKVATRVVKPTGEYIVDAGEEAMFLAPLPVDLIPGLELDDLKRLRDFNLTRTGEVAILSLLQLDVMFGKRSQYIYEAVRGIDSSPVFTASQKQPMLRADHTFGNDTNDVASVRAVLYRLAERIGADLRRRRLATRRLGLVVDYSDGKRTIRQARVYPATAHDNGLFAAAQKVLMHAWTRRIRIRHLRLMCDRLTFPPAQQELFADTESRRQRHDGLMVALDAIRHRFGFGAIQVGRTLSASPI